MAATRLIRMSRPPSSLGEPSSKAISSTVVRVRLRSTCMAGSFSSENNQLAGEGERKPVAVTRAAACMVATLGGTAVAAPEQTNGKAVDLATLMAFIRAAILRKPNMVTKPKLSKLIIQSLIEKVIIDCRFFTMLAVAGTLLGSILCFLEGVFLVVESYLQYFHGLAHHSDYGHVLQLLIEALDMFLVGTAMLTFGMGLHVMFVGSPSTKANIGSRPPSSNLFGLFYLKEFPSWAGMRSISEAKSKMGHALMLLLQVGVVEKLKSIPLVTALDLACLAGAIFMLSAALFILSKLTLNKSFNLLIGRH